MRRGLPSTTASTESRSARPICAAIEQWVPSKFAGARVLEIACGTGYWTQFIAPVALHVTALDAAPETLDIARGRVPGTNVEFLVGDAYDLPQQRELRLRRVRGFWFSHVPRARQREFLVGLNAALRPGARVVLLDNRYVEGSSTPVTEHDADGNGYQARRLADGSTASRPARTSPPSASSRPWSPTSGNVPRSRPGTITGHSSTWRRNPGPARHPPGAGAIVPWSRRRHGHGPC